jgi:hypothetical protein
MCDTADEEGRNEISVNQKNDLNRRILNCMVTDGHIGEGQTSVASCKREDYEHSSCLFEESQRKCQQF